MTSVAQRKIRICRKCGGTYSEVFFERARVGKSSYLRRPVCIGCRLSARTNEKRDGKRTLKKAQAAILTHAPKLKARGQIVSVQELVTRYGWRAVEMAHDIDHAFKNGCPYCCEKFATMPHGLGDVTLDIVDPDRPPYYKTNVKWVCMTCNREKSRTPPDEWAEKLSMWAEWRERQKKINQDPWAGTLFEGIEDDEAA